LRQTVKVLFAKADVYIKTGRNLNVAKDLLKRYLSLALTPEDPPRSQAEKLLKQVQGGLVFLGEALRFSAQALRANPVRSLLTGLGW